LPKALVQGGALLAIAIMCLVAGNTAQVRAQSSTLPSGWTNRDIGSSTPRGSTTVSGGTWTIAGGGDNVWDSADEFHFAYRTMSGDVDISARLSSFDEANEWSKAGLMIRDGLTANGRNAFVALSPGVGAALQRRTSAGGDTTRTASGSGDAPAWLRLVRKGSSFTAYRSSDGRSWTTIATTTISMPTTIYVGPAVSSRDAAQLARATFTNLQIGAALPTPWRNRDVGSPTRAGAATSSAPGTFSVTGAGEAIWGNADQFQYVYQPIQGDTEIVARVASLQVTHAGAKAGVMIRESLNAGARHASMFATGGNGWTFQYRDVTNGMSFVSADTGGSAPGWVRLVRAGDRLTGYHSSDGKSWSVVGSETIDMASSVYVGLAVSSRVESVTTAATFTNVAVSKGSSGSNAPPTVSITGPSANATYNAPASMIVTAAASDSDGTVSRVDIYQGSTLLKSDTTVPYSVKWNDVGPGTYQLTAVARDNDGATKTSTAVTVTVRSASNQPPSVSISSPASGASFTAPANIAIQAATSDSDGRVTRVEFYRGTTLIGSDSTSPYSVTWTGAPVGTYTLTAKAFDEDGGSRTSSGVSVSVRSAQNQLPTVSITSPSTGATFTAPASVTINATASDADGTVAGVDFYVGSQLFATDTTSPYSASWTNVAAGSYSLTARARDNSGGTRTSSAVSVTVRAATSRPTRVVFAPSADHASNVTSYTVAIYRASDPVTASPIATRNLGKPAVVSGEISVDISTLVDPLVAGSYYAVVRAVGPGGTTPSSKSTNFTK
jgi:regulation of enolase protein 1 (concanavalin A-like superfamily)